MPDLEITGLPVLPEASVAATDAAVLADVSASETKQLTVKALLLAVLLLLMMEIFQQSKLEH